MPRRDLIQLRRGSEAEWAAANPVLDVGEPGLDTTNGVVKYGDGTTAWADLEAPAGGAMATPNFTSYLSGARMNSQTLPSQIAATQILLTDLYDSGGDDLELDTDVGGVLVHTDGLYTLVADVSWENNNTGKRMVQFSGLANPIGYGLGVEKYVVNPPNNFSQMLRYFAVPIAGGSTIKVLGRQESGAPLDVEYTEFGIARIL